VKKAGAEIVQPTPSVLKLDEMVGKNTTMNYEFPENVDIDSDKVRSVRESLKNIKNYLSYWVLK
jgi:hypothetical protein